MERARGSFTWFSFLTFSWTFRHHTILLGRLGLVLFSRLISSLVLIYVRFDIFVVHKSR